MITVGHGFMVEKLSMSCAEVEVVVVSSSSNSRCRVVVAAVIETTARISAPRGAVASVASGNRKPGSSSN